MTDTSIQRAHAASLPHWVLGQATPPELAVLLALQSYLPACNPSLTDLANRSSLSRSGVCKTLNELSRKGWLRRQTAQESSGRNAATRYELLIWHGVPLDKSAGAPVQNASEHQQNSPAAKREQKRNHGAAPIDLLTRFVAFKGAVFVYLMLQQFEAPSISLLSTVCAMQPSDVRRALRALEADGWIQRIERPGSTSLFRVFFERVGAHQG